MLNDESEYINFPIVGMGLHIKDKMLIVESDKKLHILNSSILGGGFSYANYVVNQQVDINYCSDEPEKDLVNLVEQIGLCSDQVVGMMTAVCIKDVVVRHEKEDDLSVIAIVTAGTSNAVAAGGIDIEYFHGEQGTINIILLIDGNLTEAAMVNAVITATEAKTMALHDLKVKVLSTGEVASGTSTDAVVVAVTSRGECLPYAGTATQVGKMIGRTVRKAVSEAENKYFLKESIYMRDCNAVS